MKMDLLEAHPPGAVGSEFRSSDERLPQTVGILERLEPVLPCHRGAISGNGNIRGIGQLQIRRGRLREMTILTAENQKSSDMLRNEKSKVKFDIEPAHTLGIRLIDWNRGRNQDAGKK
jgi:hypothetical protein